MSLIFLGESIHGVSEFTRFKRDWIRQNASARTAVVFEADHIGLMRSAELGESPEVILNNFPRIHRTQEMLELLNEIIDREIPYFGADVVTRNQIGEFPGKLALLHEKQASQEKMIYSSPDPFPLRDRYMSDVIASIYAEYPGHNLVGFFHNLHIKKHGSREVGELCLPSVAEQLAEIHGIESRSIGLFALEGSAMHNDLTPFEFAIRAPDVIETIDLEGADFRQINDPELMGDRTAYHHAFEKETLPVRMQYDECAVFLKAGAPSLR